MIPRFCCLIILFATLVCAANLNAQVVYDTGGPTGFFTPFGSSTAPGTKFGDSGWFGNGSDDPVGVTSIRLGMATLGDGTAAPAGTTDIVFTFNDGDPSGLVFGPGTTLYSETITNVMLPASSSFEPTYFDLVIDLPNIMTSGGFNNFGFSIGIENFDYEGLFGFQNRGDFNVLGSYTNNASEFTPGSGWSLFAFGPNNPEDIANFVATVTVPESQYSILSISGLVWIAVRRRR